ncbi:META domain-containing protein [Paragemmobacter ruber]|uniref:META domain-containing protein n=1 Tax=Paragemmobacter ruber TaxID=1985673 RepID=A0ABW9Y677_9RHOB|nr:META domain-containing protein [Rhodobacter ruber]NBE08046.1 META domain-containing protein [Rhodobacter ruber]
MPPRRTAMIAAAFAATTTAGAHAQDSADLLPFTARGNEPFWSLTVTPEGSTYTDMEGLTLTAPFTEPSVADGARLYPTAAGPLRLTETLCRDSMSGMPYPFTVTLNRDGADLPGCAGDPARLLAGEWVVTTLDGAALAKGADVTLAFDAGRIAGLAACNRYAGSYTLTGEGLTFGPMAGTRMACPEPLMATEAAVYAAFARVTQFDIAPDGSLLLKADEATTLFTATR